VAARIEKRVIFDVYNGQARGANGRTNQTRESVKHPNGPL